MTVIRLVTSAVFLVFHLSANPFGRIVVTADDDDNVVAASVVTWCPDGYRLGHGSLDSVCQLKSCLDSNDHGTSRGSPPNDGHAVGHGSWNVPGRQIVSDREQCTKPTSHFIGCPKKVKLSGQQYRLADNGTGLMIRGDRNFDNYVPLGEFVIVAGDAALVCDTSSAIKKSGGGGGGGGAPPVVREPDAWPNMCMPFTLPASRCRPLSDGTLSAVNVTFRPGFFAQVRGRNDDGSPAYQYALCHGLSEEFVHCPYKGRLPAEYSYERPEDMSLYTNLSVEIIYELGSYIWMANRTKSVVCINAVRPYRVDKTVKLMAEISMIASAVCLLLTLAVNVLFPTSSTMNNHTRVLMCQTGSLLVMFVAMTLRFFRLAVDTSDVQCYAIFAVSYVGTLGSFFWLSVLAFELWRAFSNMRPTVAGTSHSGKKRLFLMQCAYAWGIPIGMCIVALTIATNRGIQNLLNIRFPMKNFCWFVEDKTIFLFLYLPVIVILAENLVFFVLTGINLRRASRGTEILNRKIGRQMFIVFTKLFVVMGLFWFAEFFTWLFRDPEISTWPNPVDLINTLQGVVIFGVYVVRRKTLRNIRSRLSSSGNNTGSDRKKIVGSWSTNKTDSTSAGGSIGKRDTDKTTTTATTVTSTVVSRI